MVKVDVPCSYECPSEAFKTAYEYSGFHISIFRKTVVRRGRKYIYVKAG